MSSVLGGDTPAETGRAWAFVLVQLALLVVIFLAPAGEAWPLPAGLAAALRVLQWAGMAVLVVALVQLGRSLTALPTPLPDATLKTGGLYRWVRHPIYTGVLGLAVPSALLARSWLALVGAVGLVVLFDRKARFEEALLARRYPDYAAYAAVTPRFLPAPWRRRTR